MTVDWRPTHADGFRWELHVNGNDLFGRVVRFSPEHVEAGFFERKGEGKRRRGRVRYRWRNHRVESISAGAELLIERLRLESL